MGNHGHVIRYLFLAIIVSWGSVSSVPAAWFTENKGQIADFNGNPVPNVLWTASSGGMNLYLTRQGLEFVLIQREEGEEEEAEAELAPVEWAMVRLDLPGATIEPASVKAYEPRNQGVLHYYKAHCPEGIRNIREYGRIEVMNIYPGIDWVLYTTSEGGFKYDFRVNPGGDPARIRMHYGGAGVPELVTPWQIRVETDLGAFDDGVLQVMQDQHAISAAWTRSGSDIGISLGTYDVTRPLIIDPVLRWATYYGGEGLDGPDAVWVQPNGDTYVAGYTASVSYPVLNAGGTTWFQGVIAGQNDVCLIKFSDAGVRQWATYYGGSSNDGFQTGLVGLDNGKILMAGSTSSNNFPTQSLAGAYNSATLTGADDYYVIQFNSNGEREWATYLGGSGTENFFGIAKGPNDRIYISGYTGSNNMPTVNPGGGAFFQGSTGGLYDAWLGCLGPNRNLMYGTYYGGAGGEGWSFCGMGLAVSSQGLVCLTGPSTSTNLTTFNPGGSAYYQGSSAGAQEAFIIQLDSLFVLKWATYFGGSAPDAGISIAYDKNDNLYYLGSSQSTNFPMVNPGGGAWFQNTNGGNRDFIIAKFSPSRQLLWSTYYGGSQNEEAYGGRMLRLDKDDQLYAAGFSYSANFPTQDEGNGSFYQPAIGSADRDVVFMKFDNNGVRLWATYNGGDGGDWANEIDLDTNYNLIAVGEWISSNGTSLMNPGGGAWFQNANAGGHDGFVIKFVPAVPLALGSFPLQAWRTTQGKHHLEWEKAAENGSRFIIEKSFDGKHFDQLTDVPSRGNPLYVRETEGEFRKDIWYRIRWVGPDGDQAFSETAMIGAAEGKAFSIVSVSPQPAQQYLDIRLSPFHGESDIRFEIWSPEGKLIAARSIAATDVETLSIREDISRLAPGKYWARVSSGTETDIAPIVITR